jgi:hypothetical protein
VYAFLALPWDSKRSQLSDESVDVDGATLPQEQALSKVLAEIASKS